MRILRLSAAMAAAFVLLAAPALSADRPNPFKGAKTWGYQLRNLEPGPRKIIADSKYDLVVIDYARGEDRHEVPLTKTEIAEMQTRPGGGKRLVIAYLSIGESENYRSYWKKEWDAKRPGWMKKENKEWKQNYVVDYTSAEWKAIVKDYMDRVLAAGFDGFYFDRVDAYYAFGDTPKARADMVKFVAELADYARAKKPDVAIMVQNAEELLVNDDYVAAIDGIAKESLLYGVRGLDKINTDEDIKDSTDLLARASKKGKEIFVVEYLSDKGNIEKAAKRINGDLGWALYVGTRGLAQLATDPLVPAAPIGDEDYIGAAKKAAAKKAAR